MLHETVSLSFILLRVIILVWISVFHGIRKYERAIVEILYSKRNKWQNSIEAEIISIEWMFICLKMMSVPEFSRIIWFLSKNWFIFNFILVYDFLHVSLQKNVSLQKQMLRYLCMLFNKMIACFKFRSFDNFFQPKFHYLNIHICFYRKWW